MVVVPAALVVHGEPRAVCRLQGRRARLGVRAALIAIESAQLLWRAERVEYLEALLVVLS